MNSRKPSGHIFRYDHTGKLSNFAETLSHWAVNNFTDQFSSIQEMSLHSSTQNDFHLRGNLQLYLVISILQHVFQSSVAELTNHPKT